ncbi:uncharacterized protein LOC127035900 isoform X2 [Gopherus flavomarginatus]|uniref:uncharacterized protein LOC127035900 isoform X2 n=1 Tax=Gopherus flavomarginatus TaxID=286002 RepID=UPI0021CBD929|nr:uncharacterized protein LOC127035900 isoform X2 [Gopherus flavomarginatus]
MTGRACKLIRNGPHFFLNCLASSFLFSILTPFPFASPSRKNLPASPRVSHQLRPASHPFAHGPCTLQSVYQTDVHVLPMHQTGPSAAGGMGEERAGCPCLMRQGEHPLMSVSRCWPWSNRVDISCSGLILQAAEHRQLSLDSMEVVHVVHFSGYSPYIDSLKHQADRAEVDMFYTGVVCLIKLARCSDADRHGRAFKFLEQQHN